MAFVFLLQQSCIERLVDARAYPVSRRHTQWRGKAQGGMRKGGYGPHMQSPLFVAAASALIDASRAERICVMCAETDPAHCHRAYISDWLVAQGERVLHLLDPEKVHEHGARLF